MDEELLEACGADPGRVCRWVFDATGNEFAADFVDWIIAKPLKILAILVLAFVFNRIIRRVISRFVQKVVRDRRERDERGTLDPAVPEKRRMVLAPVDTLLDVTNIERARQRAETLGAVLRSVATAVVYTIAAVSILGEFDINLGPLIAGAGIAGVALGFGAQSLVRDFLSGFFMLSEDQFGVGDAIDVGECSGVVEGVTLRVTRIRDVEGTLWFVPNGEIHRVANRSQHWARAVLDIGVAYDSDIDEATRVIKEVADELWRESLPEATIQEEPAIWGVEAFGPDAITIRLVVKTDPGEQWTTARILRRRLKAAFDAAGIEIPFPQRTIWMRTPDDRPPEPDEPA